MFIKIFDKKTALALSERGFLYMKEKINKEQTVYVFEQTKALSLVVNEHFSTSEMIESDTLCY